MIFRKKPSSLNPNLRQSGFILLEVLIAVIVILGLTIWWAKDQNRIHKEKTSDVITQQINTLFNAASNFYTTKKGSPYFEWDVITINDLLKNHYILNKNKLNPYGEKYIFRKENPNTIGSQGKYLQLITDIPKCDEHVARQAITSILNASVTEGDNPDSNPGSMNPNNRSPWSKPLAKNMVRITVNMKTPNTIKTDPLATHFMTMVKPGEMIQSSDANCINGYQAQIYTAVSSCVYMSNQSAVPLNGCQTYALRSGDGWMVHMRAITPDGVHDSYSYNETNNFRDSRILVTLKCKITQN